MYDPVSLCSIGGLPEGGNLQMNKLINQEKICSAVRISVADKSARLNGENAGGTVCRNTLVPNGTASKPGYPLGGRRY
jgi:hypothetical protein